MTITERELHLIASNPWNTRPIDEDHAQVLAVDIAEHGLLQPAVGRQHPQRPEYLQLASGHHRLHAVRRLAEAWQAEHPNQDASNPWGRFPVDVRELTDLQMATIAIAENERRRALTALEKARSLAQLIAEFKLSQAEAGKPFGLGQPAVANLLRLLRLPEPIQTHVQSGALPERLARQLVSVAKIFPAEAQKIADVAAAAEPDQRESEFGNSFETFERQKGVSFNGVAWKPDWPKAPLKLDGHKSLTEIPPCVGCEFYRKGQYVGATCLRPECFKAKDVEWAWTLVPAAARKTGLPAGARGKAYAYLIDDKTDDKYVQAVLKSKHASLVVVPSPADRGWRVRQTQKGLLGSELVTLATSDLQGIWKAVPRPKAKPAPKAVKAHDWEAEHKEREAKRQAVDSLFLRAAPLLARAVPWKDPVTRLLWDTVGDVWGNEQKFKQSRTPLERAGLFVEALLHHKAEYVFDGDPKVAREIVTEAAQAFGAKLPPGWDVFAPVAPVAKSNGRAAPKKQSGPAAHPPAPAAAVATQAIHVRGNGIGHSRPAPKPNQLKSKRKTTKKGT